MKIKVNHVKSEDGEVFVRGTYGPRTADRLLTDINREIETINSSLRKLRA